MLDWETDEGEAEEQERMVPVRDGEDVDIQRFKGAEAGAEAEAETAEIDAGWRGDVAAGEADLEPAGHGDGTGSTR